MDDLDARLAAFAEHGIEAGPVIDINGPGRMVEVFDPEGNKVSFVQVPALPPRTSG